MRCQLFALNLAFVAVSMGGCAQQSTVREIPRLMYVPSSSIIQSPYATVNASQVLPGADGDIFIARGEKSVAGGLSIGEVSAYTTFTYDAQVISRDHGNVGYRYRWVTQQGITLPNNP